MLEHIADGVLAGDGATLGALTRLLERHLRELLTQTPAATLPALQPALAAYTRAALGAGHALELVRAGATNALSVAMRPETPMLARVDAALAVSRFVEIAARGRRSRGGFVLAEVMRPRTPRRVS